MTRPALDKLAELMERFADRCSPTPEELTAIDTLAKGVYGRLERAEEARRGY